MSQDAGDSDVTGKLKIYAVIVFLLVILALASFLFLPKGGSLGSCKSLVISESRDQCLTELAISTANASVCGLATGSYSTECYMQIAQNTGNSTMCSELGSGALESQCVMPIAVREDDYGLCEKISEPYLSKCVEQIALQSDNATLCGNVANATDEMYCTSLLGIKSALDFKSAEYCLNVSSEDNPNFTSSIIVNFTTPKNATAQPTTELVTSFLPFTPNVTFTARDFCYTALATATYNTSLCDSVTYGEGRTLCVDQATKITNTTASYSTEIAGCSALGSYSEQCIEGVELSEAVQTKNVSICAQFQEPINDNCYAEIASTYKNSTFCSYISNSTEESLCVSNS